MGKIAILLNATPENVELFREVIELALGFDEAGHEVEIFLDSVGTRWPEAVVDTPASSGSECFREAKARGLVAGACGHCANVFEATGGCETTGVEVLCDADEHAPDIDDLVDEGYQLLMFY